MIEQLQSSHTALFLRRHLRENEPCPVCGSLHHAPENAPAQEEENAVSLLSEWKTKAAAASGTGTAIHRTKKQRKPTALPPQAFSAYRHRSGHFPRRFFRHRSHRDFRSRNGCFTKRDSGCLHQIFFPDGATDAASSPTRGRTTTTARPVCCFTGIGTGNPCSPPAMERKEFYGGTGKEKKNRRTGGTTSNRHTGSSHRTGQTSRKKSPDQRRNFAVIHPHFLFRQRNPPSVHSDSGRKIEISRRLFSGK